MRRWARSVPRRFRSRYVQACTIGVVIAVVGVGVSLVSNAHAYGANAFVMIVKTDNPGTSNSTSFTIPITGAGYSYNVDCNDDGVNEVTARTTSYTCTYGSAGTKTIAITGTFPRIYFNNAGDRQKLLEVKQWGTIAWTSMDNAFYGCNNMHVTATDAPNLTNVTNMSDMFRDATSMNENINHWNTSTITNMSYLFAGMWYNGTDWIYSSFNQPLTSWDTSAVTDMSGMFFSATAFNQPLASWDTSAVTDMSEMFSGATAFNQPLASWNTSAVTNMSWMFYGATAFNQPLASWNTSAVTNMSWMFSGATAFNQPLTSWNTSAVTSMNGMFNGATAFNQPLTSWNTSAVTSMNGMFNGATAFNQPLTSWNTSAVTSMSGMFNGATAFNQPLTSWNTSAVTNMSWMFVGATAFNQPLDNWNTSAVTNMSWMFVGATAFNQPLDNWDTSAVTDMSWMFNGATAFNQPLDSWNTSAVTDMSEMFSGATAFNQPLTSWNTSAVTNMSGTFDYSGYTTSTYDQTLVYLASQSLQPNVSLGAAGISYCNDAARSVLTSAPNNWTITDGGYCPPTITSPSNLEVLSAPTPSITGSAVAQATVYVVLDGVQTTVSAQLDGSFTYPVTSPLSDGWHTVHVYLKDSHGTAGPSIQRSFYIHTGGTIALTGSVQAPTLSWSAAPGVSTATIWTKTADVATSFPARGSFGAASLNGKLWAVGGQGLVGNARLNDVWSSPDGITWTREVTNAPWSARNAHTVTTFNGKLWVMGGQTGGPSSTRRNDIWSSSDGITWTQEVANAPWPARSSHEVVVHDNKLWLIGGADTTDADLTDVWNSSDGVNWTQVTGSANWPSRRGFGVASFDGKLWVMGGLINNWDVFDNDVWSSTDGVTWTEETTNAAWQVRASHQVEVFDGKLWILGGSADDWDSEYSDVWFSENGKDWIRTTERADWTARRGHSSAVFDNKLWVLGGRVGSGWTLSNDVWSAGIPPTTYTVCWDTVEGGCAHTATTTNLTFTIPDDLTKNTWYMKVAATGQQNQTLGSFTASPYQVTDPVPVITPLTGKPVVHPVTGTPSTAPLASAMTQATLSVASYRCSDVQTPTVRLVAPDGLTVPETHVTLLGGVAFTVDCTGSGQSADVALTLGTTYGDTSKLRAYKGVGSTLTDITSQVTFVNTVVDGTTKTVIRYNLTDGGTFDEDGSANGTLVDPIYVGLVGADGSLSNTGTNVWMVLAGGISSVIIGAVLALRFGRKRGYRYTLSRR